MPRISIQNHPTRRNQSRTKAETMTRITAEKINPAANYLAELLNELNLACAHQGITLKIHTSPWNTGDEHRRFEVSLVLEYEPEVVFASKVDEPHKPNT